MPEFYNPNNYAVHLLGPEGRTHRIKARQRLVLPEYFEKYVARGFLKKAEQPPTPQQATTPPKPGIQSRIRNNRDLLRPAKPVPTPTTPAPQPSPGKVKQSDISRAKKIASINRKPLKAQKVVGRTSLLDANALLQSNLDRSCYPVSNNIGIGILSFNRAGSLRRLVESILTHTDLRRTTVFISDDASTDQETRDYLAELSGNKNLTIIINAERLGIAGNTNRLLRCLSRFQYGLILNDDVEVKRSGWEAFYPDALDRSGLHHLIYREPGVYGAVRGFNHTSRGVNLLRVDDRPHGAVLAFTNHYLKTVGFFDRRYGLYGLEHVDWSQRAWEMGLQSQGFFDAAGSEVFFKLHDEASSVENRSLHLKRARAEFASRGNGYCEVDQASAVPEITYVIPFRDFERTDSIRTVVNNVRAQRFPVIHINLVEQDTTTRIAIDDYQPINHMLIDNPESGLFNKSKAFNLGVARAPSERVILHDADMLAQGHYTQTVYDTLTDFESCHIGKTVLYTLPEAGKAINNAQVVGHDVKCERVVGYYEGGSLACTRSAYWKIGGFNEDYHGYGCFLPGNYVLTDGGYKAIETVTSDNKLYTHEGRFQGLKLRTRLYNGPVLDIHIHGRLPIKGVTPEHPFLVQTGQDEFMWKRADALRDGDVVASADHMPELVQPDHIGSNSTGKSKFGTVCDVKEYHYTGQVYNFEVDNDHSYVVNGLIVHNCEDCDFYARLSGASRWKENRTFDFLHLWHSRIGGWNAHHDVNRTLEAKLKALPILERVALQHQQLRRAGYSQQLGQI